jgi:hypothetical protein
MVSMENPQTDAQSYAWNWFALHSGQRLQLVNFWLVAVAFLATAFVEARASHLYAIACGVCFTGVISSLAFLMLDMRTRRLVHVAERALRYFEEVYVENGLDDVTGLVKEDDRWRKSRIDSYRVIIEGLQLAVAGMFLAAAIYSLALVLE